MPSSAPASVERIVSPLPGHRHPLFRSQCISSYQFEVAAGNNASPTTKIIDTLELAKDAGLYLAVLVVGNNTSVGWFRLDDGGTVTFVQDSGAVFAGTPTDAKVAIYNNSGVLTINNRLGAASTAAAATVTIAKFTNLPV